MQQIENMGQYKKASISEDLFICKSFLVQHIDLSWSTISTGWS